MNIKKTTFDNYIEQYENLCMFKQLRWFNKSVGLENLITELERSIFDYYNTNLMMILELREECQS